MLPGALEAAATAIGFAADVSSFAKMSRGNRRKVRPVVEALREIYFTPRGTLTLLKTLADDRMPDREDVEDVLVSFNDAEWRVERLMRILDFDGPDGRKLSL